MKRMVLLGTLFAIASPHAVLSAQGTTTPPTVAADANPAFDVSTIKPSNPEERLVITVKGRQFVTKASSLDDLIAFAYGVHANQIIGGPSWLKTEKYDLTAQSDLESLSQVNGQQLKLMVQKLLADRFGLAFHRAKKRLSVFTIVIGKTGPKLVESSADPNSGPRVGFHGPGVMTAKNATLSDFAGFLQRYVLDRPVVDQTNISGKYDFRLNWAPNETQFEGRGLFSDAQKKTDDAPDLFTAMQEQLGLKFKSARIPVDVLIVDRVEKPTPN